jgi:hypothetical protein
MEDKITIEELQTWGFFKERLLGILNKEYDLEQAIEDVKSFRNTEWYTGNDEKYKYIIENE